MAEVFLAEQRGPAQFSRRVALKRMLPEVAADEAFVKFFYEEAQLAALLQHPNIIQIHDFGEIDGLPYICMEYAKGTTLYRAQKARERGLSPIVVATIGAHISAGLAFAHQLRQRDGSALNIVHRDVSPDNVFLTLDGVAKLFDFGIARSAVKKDRTAYGTIKGKPAYMSPEQARAGALDGRSDVFSLGVVLWECATRQRLFPGGNLMQVIKAVTSARPRPLLEVAPGFDPKLAEVIAWLLEPDRERRPGAQEVQAELDMYLHSRGVTNTHSELAAFLRGEEVAESASAKRSTFELRAPTGDEVSSWLVANSSDKWYFDFVSPDAPEEIPTPSAGSLPFDISLSLTISERRSKQPLGDAPPMTVVSLEAPASRRPVLRWLRRAAAGLALFGLALASGWAFHTWRASTPTATGPPAPAAPATQALRISTAPPGAALHLDELDTGLRTPAQVEVRADREVQVTLSLPGHQSWQGQAGGGGPAELEVDLVALGVVELTVEPADAQVRTPQGVRLHPGRMEWPEGVLELRAERPGHVPVEVQRAIKGAKTTTVRVVLPRAAYVDVNSIPNMAEVLLNGRPTGCMTPCMKLPVVAGRTHRIGVRTAEGASRTISIRPLHAGGSTTVSATVRR